MANIVRRPPLPRAPRGLGVRPPPRPAGRPPRDHDSDQLRLSLAPVTRTRPAGGAAAVHNPVHVLALAAGGFGAGVALALYDVGSTGESRAFAGTPEFKAWLFLYGAQPALCAALTVPLWVTLRRLRPHLVGRARQAGRWVLLVAALLQVPLVLLRPGGWARAPLPPPVRNPLAHAIG